MRKKKWSTKVIDTPHKNPFSPIKLGTKGLAKSAERTQILGVVKKHKGIVYGSTAAKAHAPIPMMSKGFTDIDVKMRFPRKRAIEMETKLDNWANQNAYYVEELSHPKGKAYRVTSRLRREAIADVSSNGKIPYDTIDGVRYETLPSRRRSLKRMLRDPEARYRREKDRANLEWVEQYERQRRNVKKPFSAPIETAYMETGYIR